MKREEKAGPDYRDTLGRAADCAAGFFLNVVVAEESIDDTRWPLMRQRRMGLRAIAACP